MLQPQIVAQVHDYLYFHCEVAYDQVLDVAFFWRHNGQVMVETEQIVSHSTTNLLIFSPKKKRINIIVYQFFIQHSTDHRTKYVANIQFVVD